VLRSRRRALLAAAALAAVVAAVAIGLAQTSGGGDDRLRPLTAGQLRDRIAGAAPVPKAIAALHAQANAILPGGRAALDARLRELRGTPVVLNVWGAWCVPCRAELPLFQRAAVDNAGRVAFLGVDTEDAASAAHRFLRQVPVPYPSYQDLKGTIAKGLGLIGTPSTIFYDRRGRSVVKQGVYQSLSDLEDDIERFADRA
jgi:thiol-disulfide isomerase/thioredoxin